MSDKYRKRIEASLRAVGLIEPFVVFPLGDDYEILDGGLRYEILLNLGVETVPCLIGASREGFTGNRMVNQLSPAQEIRMLRKSLEELDEKTIANALGIAGIGHRLNLVLMKKLAPEISKAFESGKISLQCAKELAHVKPERQVEILALMESCRDYTVTFAKGLVLKTPVAKRAKPNGVKTPWTQADEKKHDLLEASSGSRAAAGVLLGAVSAVHHEPAEAGDLRPGAVGQLAGGSVPQSPPCGGVRGLSADRQYDRAVSHGRDMDQGAGDRGDSGRVSRW